MWALLLSKLRSRKSQRGAAALEFAVVVPVLMLLVCGMVDFAMVFNGQAVVTNGARDGVRAASLGKKFATTSPPTSTINTVIANETAGLTNPSAVSWSVCTAATINATTWTCSPSTTPTDSAYDNARKTDWIVRVTVSYTYSWITPLPTMIGQGSTTTIRQVSYMRIENT